MNKPKPDNRSNNADRIQFNINHTIRNMEAAEDMMSKVDDPTQKSELEEKNDRRRDALQGMREEIKDEAHKKSR
ncbi:small acid-soluble spore protein Tlp [Ruminiclostridium cellobioparum]|jgi:small acid-soluble spore protein (thioredoxin-like protein)|uniref:Protein Tlp homolog n=1 Tax=Ruminiclostridium cellobioparum subsp. termitidis CT1112 TaxID=1195236 RepID=S0FRA4_RUMCE|nr:small acid-soluble spore protein Tlp [Ruminiclostridium cellobioparum]EMS71719.1 small, acid-soluble spore protein tlp [Ruminiclostridium cellobioparum subsp. termitidis CT1112]